MRNLRLMAILAHPDDESLGMGGTLARYASEGVEVTVVTATRGERGRNGASRSNSPMQLAALREAELLAACRMLGVWKVRCLGYPDGELDQVDPCAATAVIAAYIRRFRPQVILTFGPDGGYGHPDHIAISQLATSAVVQAAHALHNQNSDSADPPHQVSKLYYMAWTKSKWDAYQAALKKLTVTVDGIERQAAPWPDWAITTVIDTSSHWHTVWRAVSCHETQMSVYRNLRDLSDDHHRALWGSQEFYRVFSVASGGRRMETDLFDGISISKLDLESSHDRGKWFGIAP